jgi:hypothetical protein
MHAQPDVPNTFAVVAVGVVIVAVLGYRAYSSLLNRTARNAKNKRIIKNEVMSLGYLATCSSGQGVSLRTSNSPMEVARRKF